MCIQLLHRRQVVGTGLIRSFTETELTVQIRSIQPGASGDVGNVEDADEERQKKRFETLEKVSRTLNTDSVTCKMS